MPKRLLLGFLCMALFACMAFGSLDAIGGSADVGVFQTIAGSVRDVRAGISDAVKSEYPPLAAAIFFFTADNPFGLPFADAWAWLLVASFAAVWLVAALRFDAEDTLLLPVGAVITLGLMGPEVFFPRYDLFVLLALFLAWRAQKNGYYGLSGASLIIAAALKVVPLLLLPALVATTPRGKRWDLFAGCVIGALFAAMLPAAVFGWEPFFGLLGKVAAYHGGRGIQIESSWASVILLAGSLWHVRIPIIFGHGAYELDGIWPGIAPTATIVTVAGAIMIALAASLRAKGRSGDAGSAMLATLLLAFSFSPVLSPQYMIWILPLMIAYAVERGSRGAPDDRRGVLLFTIVVLIGVCTRWIYPLHYWNAIIDPQLPSALFVLVARNALLLVLFFLVMSSAGFFRVLGQQFELLPRVAAARRPEFLLLCSAVFLPLIVVLLLAARATQPAIGFTFYKPLPDGMPVTAELPLSIASTGRRLQVNASMTLPSLSSRRFHISPDDCLDELTINGRIVEDEIVHFCGVDGRDVDLSDFLRSGENTLRFVVSDHGGMQGVRMHAVPDWRQTAIPFLIILLSLAEGAALATHVFLRRNGK